MSTAMRVYQRNPSILGSPPRHTFFEVDYNGEKLLCAKCAGGGNGTWWVERGKSIVSKTYRFLDLGDAPSVSHSFNAGKAILTLDDLKREVE